MLSQVILGPGGHDKSLASLRSAGLTVISSTDFVSDHRADLVIVIGGDGTIHRFLPDLIRAKLPVLVVPAGSGNDLARTLGINSCQIAIELARDFARQRVHTIEIDVGNIIDEDGGQIPFCCTGGVGLDAIAGQFANSLPRWIRGNGGYLLAAARALFTNPALNLDVAVNTAEAGYATRISQSCCLFTFANTPSFGGGLRIAPYARLDDGQLDCVIADDMSTRSLVRAAISLLRGTHLQLKEVSSMRAETLRIESDPPSAVYADGEFVCETPVEVRISPRALRVLRAD